MEFRWYFDGTSKDFRFFPTFCQLCFPSDGFADHRFCTLHSFFDISPAFAKFIL
jgi:hypothetical protein